MATHRVTDPDAVEGVGLRDWGGDPERRARAMQSAGGAILMVTVAGIVLCFVATAFGLAPLAVPVLVLLVPAAFGGSALRARGAARLRRMQVEAARRE